MAHAKSKATAKAKPIGTKSKATAPAKPAAKPGARAKTPATVKPRAGAKSKAPTTVKPRAGARAKTPATASSTTATTPGAKPGPGGLRGETPRTRAQTVSERAETPRTRAPTALDVSSQTRRTRAPTVSERAETPRTRAPTERPGIVAATPKRSRADTVLEPPRQPDAPMTLRSRTDTVLEPPRHDAAPRRSRTDTLREPPIIVSTLGRDDLAKGDLLGDPARVAELAALEVRIDQLAEPEVLVALASQIDTLGMQLAFEISRHAHDAAHVAPLKPVLIRVPEVHGRALVRAAEKFDDLGSPRRAAYVLFEALRKAFDPDVIGSVSAALAFILDAHEQGTAATQLRALVSTREEQRAAGVDRKEVRIQFASALELLRDRGVDWTALADDPPRFD